MTQSRQATHRFASPREAKEYLVSQIVDEAQREAMPLSEVERKMLYFSETDWTLPDIMDVNERFDQEYDQNEYEQKIAGLIKKGFKRLRSENPSELDSWRDAVRILRKEDHYILVMVNQAGVSFRPPHDRLKLWMTALLIVAGLVATAFVSVKYNFDWTSRDTISFLFWTVVACVALLLIVIRLAIGRGRAQELFVTIMEKLFGSSAPSR